MVHPKRFWRKNWNSIPDIGVKFGIQFQILRFDAKTTAMNVAYFLS
jgi:hypothetical protein